MIDLKYCGFDLIWYVWDFIFVTWKFSETAIMDDTSEKERKSAEQNEKDQVKTAYSVLNRFEFYQ